MKSAFVKEALGRTIANGATLTRADRAELRRYCEWWFDAVGWSLTENYELTFADFRPRALQEMLLMHALDGEQPHYFLDWVLMPLVKKKPHAWLTEDAWLRWRDVLLERRSL